MYRSLSLLLVAISLCIGSPAVAQSIVAGDLVGTVQDTVGLPLSGVRVALTDRSTGVLRAVRTGADGTFRFGYLPPGPYDLFAEQIGYRPVRLLGLSVQACGARRATVVLHRVQLPVDSVAVVAEREAARSAALGSGEVLGGAARLSRPRTHDDLFSILESRAERDPSLGIDGLPARLAGVEVDGVPYEAASHPAFSDDPAPLPFVADGLDGAAVGTPCADVEWDGFAGGTIHATSARGTRDYRVRAHADWTGNALASSGFFDPSSLSYSRIRAGGVLSGPVVTDTAHFVIGFDAERGDLPVQPAWADHTLDDSLIAVVGDSLGYDFSPWTAGRAVRRDRLNAFGRFDWQIAAEHHAMVRANVGTGTDDEPGLGVAWSPAVGAQLTWKDLSVVGELLSQISTRTALEFRGGVSSSRRDYTGGLLPLVSVTGSPLQFGTPPGFDGRFAVTTLRVGETVHLAMTRHRVKLGLTVQRRSIDNTYRADAGGERAAASLGALIGATGSWVQAVGRLPVSRYTATEVGGFLQDRWTAAPGLTVVGGVRLLLDKAPLNLPVDVALATATGIVPDSFASRHTYTSPRLGFEWDVGERHTWFVRANAGWFRSSFETSLASELLTRNGSTTYRRAVGSLVPWPIPDSTSAAPGDEALTLLGPTFEPPHTGLMDLGISGAIGKSTLHLSATYRHTDFLPRRVDLNRLPARAGVDQYGRPLWGTLVQDGALLSADPATNRRFDNYDVIAAVNADGYSDYVGLGAALEGGGRVVQYLVGYQWSRTTDNWPLTQGGRPQDGLSPFPGGLAGLDWLDGRSDLDIPHRLDVALGLTFGRVQVAGFYTLRSGLPFTPGFPDGVDANADGSSRNDPAFIDDQMVGVSDLFGAWDCLRQNAGRFAARNSCRGPAVSSLDARLTIGPFGAGAPIRIVFEALDLVEPNNGLVDRALYRVDPAGTVSTAGGMTTVPLMVNPDFGKPLRRTGFGRMLRVGVRIGDD